MLTWTCAEFLNPVMMSLLMSMSLNMPSNLLVNWDPHSVLNLPMVLFSASMDELLPSKRRLARSFL